MDQLAKSSIGPSVEVLARVDGKLASLAESRPTAEAGVLRECRGYAWNAIALADVAGGIGATHVERYRLRLHVELQQWLETAGMCAIIHAECMEKSLSTNPPN
jgi:hypothetical protein